eukprot:1523889-Rhodomonas_salina.1
MSGTELAYGAMRCPVLSSSVWRYAMSGTDLAYGARRYAALLLGIVLWPYAMVLDTAYAKPSTNPAALHIYCFTATLLTYAYLLQVGEGACVLEDRALEEYVTSLKPTGTSLLRSPSKSALISVP